MQAEGADWQKIFARRTTDRVDYIFNDGLIWTDDKGRWTRIYRPQDIGPFTVLSFMLFGALETFQPLTALTLSYIRRWLLYLVMWIVTSYLLVLALRISSVNYSATLNPLCPGLLFFLIDDFSLWLIYFALHCFGWLWPWHSTHHSDPDMDASTGFRFHPVETMLDQSC